MKAIMIIFNQANTERVEYLMDYLEVRGWTMFPEVQGRGSRTGDPRRGTHAWPEMNSCVITIVPDDKEAAVLEAVKKLDLRNEEVGVRAFTWNIEKTV